MPTLFMVYRRVRHKFIYFSRKYKKYKKCIYFFFEFLFKHDAFDFLIVSSIKCKKYFYLIASNLQLIPNFLAMRSARSLQYPSKRSFPSRVSPGSADLIMMYGSSTMVVTIYVLFRSMSAPGFRRIYLAATGLNPFSSVHSATWNRFEIFKMYFRRSLN